MHGSVNTNIVLRDGIEHFSRDPFKPYRGNQLIERSYVSESNVNPVNFKFRNYGDVTSLFNSAQDFTLRWFWLRPSSESL